MAVDETRVRRLDSMTGLRFLFALGVFLFHAASMSVFRTSTPGSDPFARITEHLGSLGVTFFFVLSGFILTWSARAYDTVRQFWRRRMFKIFPNHLVTFVLSVLLYASVSAAVVPAVFNVTLLHAWVPRMDTFLSFNYVTWSLSCEVLFYLLFPFLLKAIRRIPAERLWWAAGGIVVLVLCVPLVAELLPTEPRFQLALGNTGLHDPIVQYWFVFTFPPVRLLDFLLGILMARIVLEGRWIRLGRLPALALLVVGYIAADYTPYHYSLNAVLLVPMALFITAVACHEANGGRTFLSSRPMLWLGETSFALYLLHVLVLVRARQELGFRKVLSPLEGIGWIVLTFVIALVAARLLYVLVERPSSRYLGTARRPRPTAEPSPVSAR
ncbi:acyltransferase family protein [Kitasatospora sp. NPDC127059]|uniref:acyltransferase family protein n=1 Tax=unclassified Kitasatospora TaxID=2633591 RepID=UPI0036540E4B